MSDVASSEVLSLKVSLQKSLGNGSDGKPDDTIKPDIDRAHDILVSLRTRGDIINVNTLSATK